MLENLATEERNEKTIDLDTLSPKEILAVMNEEDLTVPIAIKKGLTSNRVNCKRCHLVLSKRWPFDLSWCRNKWKIRST